MRRDPPVAEKFGQKGVRKHRASLDPGRHEFRNHAVAVCYQDRFAFCREANVCTQLVFQLLDAHGAHEEMVATRSY